MQMGPRDHLEYQGNLQFQTLLTSHSQVRILRGGMKACTEVTSDHLEELWSQRSSRKFQKTEGVVAVTGDVAQWQSS
jgi:hypothetical protein